MQAPTEPEDSKILLDRILNRMEQDWPGVRLHLAAVEACRWLREGAPGRALEALETALSHYDRKSV